MIITTKEINNKIQKSPALFVAQCEDDYLKKIKSAADFIVQDKSKNKPLVFISGPSGSGKTTTAIKLSKEIRRLGQNVCYISMDKYFKVFTDEERELKRQNKIDLESPDRLDVEFLHSELDRLINGGSIEIPTYDFATNTRGRSGTVISRNNGFVIIEGIHALNPSVVGDVDNYSSRIYASVRTRVVDNDGDKLHPCKIRLMRRIMRDNLYRKRSPEQTIKMFPHVQYGENKNILPYKSRADVNIDTFLPYEPALYKKYLYDELIKLSGSYSDVRDIVKAMDEFTSIDENIIPPDALLREFIGGSSLSY